MKRFGTKEIEVVSQLGHEERLRYFVKWVADGQAAWGAWEDGWSLTSGADGREALPLWPGEPYVERCLPTIGGEPSEIPLDDLLGELLPKLERRGICVAVFPVPPMRGVVVSASEVDRLLREELAQYE